MSTPILIALVALLALWGSPCGWPTRRHTACRNRSYRCPVARHLSALALRLFATALVVAAWTMTGV